MRFNDWTDLKKSGIFDEIFGEDRDDGDVEILRDDLYKEPPKGYNFISCEGGGEGGSEHCETVFEWNGECFKVTYSYYSYDGFETDCAQIKSVTPKVVEVTIYE